MEDCLLLFPSNYPPTITFFSREGKRHRALLMFSSVIEQAVEEPTSWNGQTFLPKAGNDKDRMVAIGGAAVVTDTTPVFTAA